LLSSFFRLDAWLGFLDYWSGFIVDCCFKCSFAAASTKTYHICAWMKTFCLFDIRTHQYAPVFNIKVIQSNTCYSDAWLFKYQVQWSGYPFMESNLMGRLRCIESLHCIGWITNARMKRVSIDPYWIRNQLWLMPYCSYYHLFFLLYSGCLYFEPSWNVHVIAC